MGYNNNNAGMHMIWHKHYAPYDDLAYYDRLASEKNRKIKDIPKKKTNINECNSTRQIETDKAIKIYKPKTKTIETIYDEACSQIDKLYNSLYISAIRNHYNLETKTNEISEYLKNQSKDGSIDDMLFLSMASQSIGTNIGQLATVTEDDIKEVIYRIVLPEIWSSELYYCNHDENIDYIECYFLITDFSDENAIRRYYMNLRQAIDADKIDSLPSISACYKMTIYRNVSQKEYSVGLSIYSSQYDNYLNYYEADVYKEKEGDIADFFEKNYKE